MLCSCSEIYVGYHTAKLPRENSIVILFDREIGKPDMTSAYRLYKLKVRSRAGINQWSFEVSCNLILERHVEENC